MGENYTAKSGDGSARLMEAVCDRDWVTADELLKDGADPRICCWGEGVSICSPLYIALEQEKYYFAHRFYEAVDRLDDLHLEGCEIPAHVLMAIQTATGWGNNYFADESKPLSECARCFQVQRCRELVGSASAEELALAAEAISRRIRRGREEVCREIISLLKKHGADFSKAKQPMVQVVSVLKKAPACLKLKPDFVTKIEALIAQI